eukprot:10111422-Karenia_brevis.AAC.1
MFAGTVVPPPPSNRATSQAGVWSHMWQGLNSKSAMPGTADRSDSENSIGSSSRSEDDPAHQVVSI